MVRKWLENARSFEIRLEDGTVAAEAEGVCIRLPQEEIEQVEEELDFWKVVLD